MMNLFLRKIVSTTVVELSKTLIKNSLQIATAESCTGGLISSRLTDVSGSSAYIKVNFITYANEAKQRFLDVSEETLNTYGAVSAQCAHEMALGLIKLTESDVVLCTTGVAGPSSSENKPVGLVYVACGYKGDIKVKEFRLNPKYSRKDMKFMFSETALKFALETINASL